MLEEIANTDGMRASTHTHAHAHTHIYTYTENDIFIVINLFHFTEGTKAR